MLRRADLPVVVASDAPGPVEGSHGIAVSADVGFGDVDVESLVMIALPGGLPGAKHLAAHAEVQRIVKALAASDQFTAAICAAPMALAAAGVHAGKKVTSYPGFDSYMKGCGSYVEDRVVVDGRVVTSRGPGTALEFALTLVSLLRGADVAHQLQDGMLVRR